MAHFVPGDIQRGQRQEIRAAIAIRHAETAVRPERIVVAVAVVHPAVSDLACSIDAVSAMDILEIIECLREPILRIDSNGLRTRQQSISPVVVGIREVISQHRLVTHVQRVVG